MRAKYILVLTFLIACGSKHSTSGDDAPSGTDSSSTDSPTSGDAGGDAMSNVDGAVGVACGTTTCSATQECCLTNGQRTCVDQGNCQGAAFECDGPEDCQMGEICCASNTGGTPGTTCQDATDMCRAIACHNDPDCPMTDPKCCQLGMTGLNVCLPQCPM
jgi:hypothetical protein